MQAELEPDELERLIRQSWESELIDITEGTTEERVSDGVTFLPPARVGQNPWEQLARKTTFLEQRAMQAGCEPHEMERRMKQSSESESSESSDLQAGLINYEYQEPPRSHVDGGGSEQGFLDASGATPWRNGKQLEVQEIY